MKYLARHGSVEDLVKMSEDFIEPVSFSLGEGNRGDIFVIECDGEIIATFDICEPDPGVCAVGCMFRHDLLKHLRVVMSMMEQFVFVKEYKEIYVKCIDGWKRGERFLTYLGFIPQKVVEKDRVDGVQYRLYKRVI